MGVPFTPHSLFSLPRFTTDIPTIYRVDTGNEFAKELLQVMLEGGFMWEEDWCGDLQTTTERSLLRLMRQKHRVQDLQMFSLQACLTDDVSNLGLSSMDWFSYINQERSLQIYGENPDTSSPVAAIALRCLHTGFLYIGQKSEDFDAMIPGLGLELAKLAQRAIHVLICGATPHSLVDTLEMLFESDMDFEQFGVETEEEYRALPADRRAPLRTDYEEEIPKQYWDNVEPRADVLDFYKSCLEKLTDPSQRQTLQDAIHLQRHLETFVANDGAYKNDSIDHANFFGSDQVPTISLAWKPGDISVRTYDDYYQAGYGDESVDAAWLYALSLKRPEQLLEGIKMLDWTMTGINFLDDLLQGMSNDPRDDKRFDPKE